MIRTPTLLLSTLSVALFAACTPTPPAPIATLELTPKTVTATAGDAAVPLEAKLENSTVPLSWTLVGEGSLSASSGSKVNYLPPASVAANTNAVVTVSAGALSKTITISLKPKVLPAPALTVTPASFTITAGDPAKPLEAKLENSSAEITWNLAGEGSLSASQGTAVSYTPPATLNTDTSAFITVNAGSLSKTITIALKAKPTVATLEIEAPSLPIVYNTEKVAFNARLIGSTAPVVWSLEGTGSNLGSIDPKQGFTTLYTPPLSGAVDQDITLRAKAGALEKTVVFKLVQPTLTLGGSTANITGGTPRTFTVSLNNRDSASAVTWTLEGVGSLNTSSGSSVIYTAPAANTVTTEQTIRLTATSGSVSKTLEFKLVPSVKLVTLTPTKTDLIAGEAPITISLLRTLIAPNAAVSFSVSPAGAGSVSVIDGNTYSYTPPASVPTGTTATVTLSFTVDGVTQTLVLNIKPKPALALITPNTILTAGDATITLTATRTDLDAGKIISYTIVSTTPALPAGATGNTVTSTAPGNTATYTPPSSVTVETKVLIRASTGNTPADASETLELTIKPKPVVP